MEIQLNYLNRRLVDRKMEVVATDAAREWLATTGYDPVYGARPLKRLIQKEIENPLSRYMLEGEFQDGDTVNVDADEEGLIFEKEEEAEHPEEEAVSVQQI